MYIDRIQLLSAPGLPNGLDLKGFQPGLNLLVGPNASGKSTAGRAVLASLGVSAPDPGVQALLHWRDAGEDRTVTLFYGRASGVFTEPVLGIGSEHPWTLTLRDLLSANDADFADRMMTELHAGYNVDALASAYSKKVRRPQKQRSAVDKARSAERGIVAAWEALADEEATLTQLDKAIAESEGMRGELDAIKRALEWREAEAQLAEAQAEIKTFDPLHARIPAALPQRIADRDAELTERTKECDAAEDAYQKARSALNALAPGPAPLDPYSVDELVERTRDLPEAMERAARAREADKAEQAALKTRTQRAGLTGAQAPDSRALDKLDQLVRDEASANARLDAETARLHALPAANDGADDDPAPLREAAVVMQQWLATALTAPAPAPDDDRYLAIALIIAAVVVAIAGVLIGGAAAWGLAAVVMIGLAAWAWVRTQGAAPIEPPAPPRWPTSGTAPPADWSIEHAWQRLIEIHAELAAREAARTSTERAHALRDDAAQARERAKNSGDTAKKAVDQWFATHKLSGAWPRTDAVARAHHLRDLTEARAECVRTLERARSAAKAEDAAWTAWTEAAARAGTSWEGGRDARAAMTHATRVRDQARAHTAATERLKSAKTERDRARRTHKKVEDARATAFEKAGLAPDERDAARRLFDAHDTWSTAQTRLRNAKHDEEAARGRVGERADLLSATPDALVAKRSEAERHTENYSELVEQKAKIEAEVTRARGGSDRADAADDVARAESALADRRSDALLSAAAGAMAQWVGEHLDRTAVPDTLRRAQARFSAFTRGAWRLVLRPNRSLGARDVAAGAVRGLDALSDATRVQLLLATRIARLEQIEGGRARPLFIDEALTTTDSRRFTAIADALATLADGGRQIVYATASEADIAAWSSWAQASGQPTPALVPTGESPRDRTWRTDVPSTPAEAAPVPSPEPGEAPGAWLARARIALPSAHTPAMAWPAPTLLYDRLDRAAALLREGVASVGQTSELIASGAPWLPLDKGAREQFAVRARMLEETLEALAVGRNRPLTWEQVRASKTISRAFEDRVRELLPTCGHDAGLFVQAVRTLKGFRTKNADTLVAYLSHAGLIADSLPLASDDILLRVRKGLGAEAGVSGSQIKVFVEWVTEVIHPNPAA